MCLGFASVLEAAGTWAREGPASNPASHLPSSLCNWRIVAWSEFANYCFPDNGFPVAQRKESTCGAGAIGDVDSAPGWGRSPEGGHGVYCLENTHQFPCGSAGKESACYAVDLGSIPGSGRSPGEGKGCPLQYSGLENVMDYISMGSQRVGHN